MFVVVLAAVGLIVGPGLAAIADWVPDRSGGGRAPFTCEACGVRRLAGSCGSCGAGSNLQVALMALVTAALFALFAGVVGARWHLLPILVFVSALIALSAVDIVRFRLPDRLLFPALAVSLVLVGLVSITEGPSEHLVPALVASVSYFVFLLIPNLVSPAGLAFGDVKLALLLGLFLGWMRPSIAEGLVLVVYALIVGMALGIASGLLVGIGRRIWGPDFLADPDFPPPEDGSQVPLLRTAFPFGPALAVAAVTVMLASEKLIGAPGLLSGNFQG